MNSSSTRRWQAEIEQRLAQGAGLEFTLAQFARAVDNAEHDTAMAAFFDGLVASGTAYRITAYRCPLRECGRPLPSGASHTFCPHCHSDYLQEGVEAVAEPFYRLEGETSRDIRWVIVIHGMNSRAKWQEEFSWEIANRLNYSAPVLIYKYGWATIDVFARFLHRRLARRLGERIRIAIDQAQKSQLPAQPDIIAHSFGTLLLAQVLEDPQFADLRFGRVITAASIIRPDFAWDRLITEARVEAVLNHVGALDGAVPYAQFAIPDAGPGGMVGYGATRVLNVRAESYGHSGFFIPENLRLLIARDGIWNGFLTRPLAYFRSAGTFTPESAWRPAPLPVRALTRALAYALFGVLAPFSWLRRLFDP